MDKVEFMGKVIPSYAIQKVEYKEKESLAELLVRARIVKTLSEAKRLIKQGALKVCKN